MRLGWRVPLPGPFTVSGSVGGRHRGGAGCVSLLGLLVVAGLAREYWWLLLIVAVLVIAAVVIIRRR
jgi:hypothetical protein